MIGQEIGHYKITGLIGKGGMGEVYRAHHTRLKRDVALKFLPTGSGSSREEKVRFEREAQAASSLDHANICTIHEIGEAPDGRLYIVMALYEGQTLAELLRTGPLVQERAIGLARQLASALERAHDAGITHRDIKPANIMVTDRDELKLLDFGLAKLGASTQLTKTGTTMGTVDYMSPEQVDAQEIGPASDIWSFGVLLHQMLGGELPFAGDSAPARMMSILKKSPRSLPEHIPGPLRDLVTACLQKRPRDRPSAASLRAQLGALHTEGSVSVTRKLEPAQRSSGSVRRLGLGVFAVVLLSVVGWWAMNRSSAPPSIDSPALDDGRVVVAPFDVQGREALAYLGEGMVDLLSARLAGVEELSAMNARAVLGLAAQSESAPDDAGFARDLAARSGAGRYITGKVLALGSTLRVTASLHATTGRPEAEPLAVATVEEEEERLTLLVDRLVARLLVQALGETDERLFGEVVGSRPLGAVKDFLEGEKLLRGGRYREAAAAYDRAVEADSTFALAYYRKSLAADWIDAPDIRSSAERAFELSDQLPQPDRDLVAALRARRNGYSNEAQQVYRSVLHQYPDEVEALVQLGEALFHENPRIGRSILEAVDPFRRAIQLEPNNLVALVHVARLYALSGDEAALERVADHLATHAKDSERDLEVQALRAYTTGDSARIASVKARLAERPAFYVWYAAHGTFRFAQDPAGAADILSVDDSGSPFLQLVEIDILVTQGRHARLRERFQERRPLRNPSWQLLETTVLTSGMLEVTEDELVDSAERLQQFTPAQLLASAWLPPYTDLTPRFMALERDYFHALALAQAGRPGPARELADALSGQPDLEGLGSMRHDTIVSLRAECHWQAGDHEKALAQLRELHLDIPHAATVRTISDFSRARMLWAELELERGDPNVARGLYRGFVDSWSPWDGYFQPLAHQRLGEIAEREGDLLRAIDWYERLLESWKDCDPELHERRESIRERLAMVEARLQP